MMFKISESMGSFAWLGQDDGGRGSASKATGDSIICTDVAGPGSSVFDYSPFAGPENVGCPRSKPWKSVRSPWAVESKFPWRVWGFWAIFGRAEPQALPTLPDLT